MALRCWRELSLRNAGVFAAMLAGAMNTKYSAVAICAGPLAVFGLRVLISCWPRKQGARRVWSWQPLAAAGCALAIGLMLTSPHWAKNWVWYGDPVYPILQHKLTLRPWSGEATRQFAALQSAAWRAPHTLVGLQESLKVLFTFSFVPHDWAAMHGSVPVFGSLFTMTLPLLLFVRRARVWGLYAAGHLCVFVWFWVQHEDRYLQGLMPLMATAVAALAVHLWRQRGQMARLGVAALFAFQVIWGADVYFIPGHLMLGGSPLKVLVDHLNSGYRKDYTQRVNAFSSFTDIRKQLSKGDVLLVHESHQQLGLGVRTLQDWVGFQGGLYYIDLRSPAAFAARMREYGATHVMWRRTSQQWNNVADELVFYDFISRRTSGAVSVSGFTISKLPAEVDEQRPFGDVVAFYGCRNLDGNPYDPGLYHLRSLNFLPLEKREPSAMPAPFEPSSSKAISDAHFERADFIVINPACHTPLSATQRKELIAIGSRGPLEYLVKATAP